MAFWDPMNSEEITQTEFAALVAPFVQSGEKIAVAVSGGPDSMALAVCLAEYLAKESVVDQKPNQSLCAFIVEHGLRAESAHEAQTVALRLQTRGIETEILPWQHDKIESRIHVQARDARYALLIEACKRHGIRKLFLAHHADDQAETVLLRFAKGSGIDGLAGMHEVSELEGIQLLRPFLGVRKARLIATCLAHKIPVVIDPSNEAEKYARGRLRRVMPLLAEEGFTVERLLDLSQRAHEAKAALDFYAKAFLREAVQSEAGGAYRLDLAALRGLPRAVGLRAVTLILASVHREEYPPERKQLVPVYNWLLDQDESEARTLNGCLIQKGDLCDKALFLREPAAVDESLPLDSGQTILWDGRWMVSFRGQEKGLEVRALGIQQQDVLDSLSPDLRHLIPQGRVRASLPALWRGHNLVAIPAFHKQDQGLATAMLRGPKWE